jgi:predicted alpha/beta hydrolase family esterase
MTVVILHGIQGYAGIHWQQWLHDELIKLGYKVLMPNLPNADLPNRKEWQQFITDLINSISQNEEIIIVGHSLGVTTALDFLEQSDRKIKKLISISGFHLDWNSELNSYFMKEKEIDFNKVLNNLGSSAVWYGDNDPYVPQEVLLSLATALKTTPRLFPTAGHLNTEAGFTQFPELLAEIIK